MKKSVIIAIIVAVVVIAIAGVVLLKLNKAKTAITASSFNSTMSQKGYDVQDARSQFAGYDYIKQALIAVSQEGYQIEFYELEDETYAKNFYNDNKYIFESSKGNASAETSTSLKNYSKYTLSSNGKYMVVSRIDNTVIYVDVDNSYKDTVKTLLSELGY